MAFPDSVPSHHVSRMASAAGSISLKIIGRPSISRTMTRKIRLFEQWKFFDCDFVGCICYVKGQADGDSKPVPITQLGPDEYDINELSCSLTEVTYEQNLFVHKRIETEFMPKEYLEEVFKEYTAKKITAAEL